MKSFKIAAIAAVLTMVTCQVCQADQAADAVKLLEKTYPLFIWQDDTAVPIDIDADGVKDIAVFGNTDEKGAVGIVSGAPSKSFDTKILDFKLYQDTQRGICGRTAKLLVKKQSEDAKETLGKFPNGYRICDKCFEIVVDDELCDPMHIYWDDKTKELKWWRE